VRPNEYFIIIWTDSVPVEDGLADAARAQAGQLLAAGPVQDVSELDSRPAGAGRVIARFGAAVRARAWLVTTGPTIDGTALLVAGATEPVWWPPERERQRPEWSRRADFPPDRLGQFVCVWADPILDREQVFDYSVHYRASSIDLRTGLTDRPLVRLPPFILQGKLHHAPKRSGSSVRRLRRLLRWNGAGRSVRR
jgi:hypothetical protein